MKCPHCCESFHPQYTHNDLLKDAYVMWGAQHMICPACKHAIIFLHKSSLGGTPMGQRLVEPKGIARPPLPAEVPARFANDYREACLVLADSPKASSALSRRCLQSVLREAAMVKPGNLFDEIEQVIQTKTTPSYIADALHNVRVIGNFAAHPFKSTATGEIVEVESGEAEWNLEVLESLFDFYFVQPASAAQRKAALNKKLQEAGKQPLP